MTQEQINELRKMAQAATPGPWMHLLGDRFVYDRLNDGCRGNAIVGVDFPYFSAKEAANLDYVAAANPAAILELIQQRDELLAEMRVIEDILNRETNTQDMGYELFRRTNFIRRAIETTERKS